jgi:FkbH-like protein
MATTPEGSAALAESFAAICRGLYGRARKVLVLDLDNTLWGGVIGDDGVDGIQIGRETAVAEAYTAFQEYCLRLRDRGVLLAVCSKNDEAVARAGFEHPDSVLRMEHFASFRANWEPKDENIEAIAAELNLGWDSFVFVDDNPAERALVAAQLPGVAVVEVGDDVAGYPAAIECGRYFEAVTLTGEDLARSGLYEREAQRTLVAGEFADYEAYLESLEMTAEIERFKPVYLERITQLTNKTNQFNVTGRRYTLAEMEAVMNDPAAVGLYGRLSDRFGDHGLVSVVVGRRDGDVLEIETWLMSCRVLKRGMEDAMLDALVEQARLLGVRRLRGHYVATRKNAMVAEHYSRLGFEEFELAVEGYLPRGKHIRVLELVRT